MKRSSILLVVCIWMMVLGVALVSLNNAKTYTVKISYCDGREPTTVIGRANERPSSQDISTYRQAVPIFTFNHKRYVNVCDVQILNELKTK